MDIGFDPNIYLQNSKTAAETANAERAVKGVNKDYTREELEETVKSFESFMVEKFLKEMKDNIGLFSGDQDSTMSQYTDLYMDTTISKIANELVENYGSRFTDSMVDQMARNYGIEEEKEK
ncbi:MAG: hypothetical protein IIZ61_04020 [Lachnospiraceae bacterium]|nr:hypothetical protein [Lachnospiraceae bacterium]